MFIAYINSFYHNRYLFTSLVVKCQCEIVDMLCCLMYLLHSKLNVIVKMPMVVWGLMTLYSLIDSHVRRDTHTNLFPLKHFRHSVCVANIVAIVEGILPTWLARTSACLSVLHFSVFLLLLPGVISIFPGIKGAFTISSRSVIWEMNYKQSPICISTHWLWMICQCCIAIVRVSAALWRFTRHRIESASKRERVRRRRRASVSKGDLSAHVLQIDPLIDLHTHSHTCKLVCICECKAHQWFVCTVAIVVVVIAANCVCRLSFIVVVSTNSFLWENTLYICFWVSMRVSVSVFQPHCLFVCMRALAFEAISVIGVIVVYNTLLSTNVQKGKQGTKETTFSFTGCMFRKCVTNVVTKKIEIQDNANLSVNNQYLSAKTESKFFNTNPI